MFNMYVDRLRNSFNHMNYVHQSHTYQYALYMGIKPFTVTST